MDKPLWFAGVCDSLLRKLTFWFDNYDKGSVSRERDMLLKGEVIKVPVQYAHQIIWHPREIDFLVQLFYYYQPKSSLTEDLVRVQKGLKQGRMIPGAVGNSYMSTMVFWKDNIQEMVKLAIDLRDGKSELDSYLEEKKPGGLWSM